MSNVNSVPCELCYSNIVRGIIHKIGNVYVCDDCKRELDKSEGVWFDGHDAEQCVHTDPPSALASGAGSENSAGG